MKPPKCDNVLPGKGNRTSQGTVIRVFEYGGMVHRWLFAGKTEQTRNEVARCWSPVSAVSSHPLTTWDRCFHTKSESGDTLYLMYVLVLRLVHVSFRPLINFGHWLCYSRFFLYHSPIGINKWRLRGQKSHTVGYASEFRNTLIRRNSIFLPCYTD
jgi:hypothetical protein